MGQYRVHDRDIVRIYLQSIPIRYQSCDGDQIHSAPRNEVLKIVLIRIIIFQTRLFLFKIPLKLKRNKVPLVRINYLERFYIEIRLSPYLLPEIPLASNWLYKFLQSLQVHHPKWSNKFPCAQMVG